MADTLVTLHISPENRAYIDKLRGETDIAEFLEHEITARLIERAIAERLLTDVPVGVDVGDADLTPEILMHLADAGEANALDFDEFKRTLYQRIKERRAMRNRAGAQQ